MSDPFRTTIKFHPDLGRFTFPTNGDGESYYDFPTLNTTAAAPLDIIDQNAIGNRDASLQDITHAKEDPPLLHTAAQTTTPFDPLASVQAALDNANHYVNPAHRRHIEKLRRQEAYASWHHSIPAKAARKAEKAQAAASRVANPKTEKRRRQRARRVAAQAGMVRVAEKDNLSAGQSRGRKKMISRELVGRYLPGKKGLEPIFRQAQDEDVRMEKEERRRERRGIKRMRGMGGKVKVEEGEEVLKLMGGYVVMVKGEAEVKVEGGEVLGMMGGYVVERV